MTSAVSTLFRVFDEKDNKRHYYYLYSVFFAVLCTLCFSWFIFSGRSLIWDWDGWDQYFKALVYYSQYLRGILHTLLYERRLCIPDWGFYFGEGNDIINTLHYYVFGDPFAFLSILVPVRFMHYFLFVSVVLRLYLAGVAFSELCFGTGLTNRYGIMSGAFSYTFCYWVFHYGTRYTYFLNPMIYLPIMILGVEHIIQKKRSLLFILATAFSAVSSFYFFYISCLLTASYIIVRTVFTYRGRWLDAWTAVGRIVLAGVTGSSIAGVLLVPVLMFFTSDSRFAVSQPFHLLHSLPYYSELPGDLISNIWHDTGLHLGMTVPVILAVILTVLHIKENRILNVLLCLCCLIVLFPICERILNGMSYPTNRWAWGFALLCSYILARQWESLFSLSTKEWKILTISVIVYFLICFILYYSREEQVFSAIPMFFICLIILNGNFGGFNRDVKSLLIFGLIAVNAFSIAFWTFSPEEDNFVGTFKENRKIWEEWSSNDTEAVKKYVNETYPRYSGVSLTKNANIIAGISNTQYYWSISNPYVNKYRSSLEMREPTFFDFEGYDDRTTPNNLAAVGYYVVKTNENKGIPYGYSWIDDVNVSGISEPSIEALQKELGVDNLEEAQLLKVKNMTDKYYSVYRNDLALPLGYCYDSFITEEAWESLNPIQKQEIGMEAACIGDIPAESEIYKETVPDYLIPYDLNYGDEIVHTDSGFVTTGDNVQLTLHLDSECTDCETYLELKGLGFKGTPEYDLYFGGSEVDPRNLYNKTNWELLSKDDQIRIKKNQIHWEPIAEELMISVSSSEGAEKELKFIPPDARFSSGRQDYLINLGYTENAVSELTITFPQRGIYNIENLNVYSVPFGEEYNEKIRSLRECCLEEISMGTDSVSGIIDVGHRELLCVAIPFSDGWSAFVDGEPVDPLCVNEHYIGLFLPEGRHSVKLEYETPYKKAGIIVTLFGIIAFICICIREKRISS